MPQSDIFARWLLELQTTLMQMRDAGLKGGDLHDIVMDISETTFAWLDLRGRGG